MLKHCFAKCLDFEIYLAQLASFKTVQATSFKAGM